jgi:hypothetical protein
VETYLRAARARIGALSSDLRLRYPEEPNQSVELKRTSLPKVIAVPKLEIDDISGDI